MSDTGKAIVRIVNDDGKLKAIVEKGLDKILRYLPERSTSILEPIELLYLTYNGLAEVYDEKGGKLGFQELISIFTLSNPYTWVEFEVYLDLRKRGKIPVKGPRPHTFLLRRSKKAKEYTHYILVLEENRPVKIATIYSFVEEALKNNWQPILAIVDRYGDITYYAAMPFHPRKVQREGRVEEAYVSTNRG